MPATVEREVVVLVPEEQSRKALAHVPDLRILVQLDANKLDEVKHLFIEVSASKLPSVTDIVKAANETKYLRALFIRADIDAKLLPQILQRADLRIMRNILVHGVNDWIVPERVMNAWRMSSENDLIAAAAVFDSRLVVFTCAFERLEVSFDAIPALKKLRPEHRTDFELDEAGSFLHWPASDTHIDVDVIRYAIDEKWRAKCDTDRLIHNKKFGQAIAVIRQRYSLRQTDIPDLTDRQLRRIESGEARPSVSTLKLIAKAHKLKLEVYLDEVSKVLTTGK